MDTITLDFSGINAKRKGRLMRPAGRKSAPKFAWIAIDTDGGVRIDQATVDQKTSAYPDGVFGGTGHIMIPPDVAEKATPADILRALRRHDHELQIMARLLRIAKNPVEAGKIDVKLRAPWASVFLMQRVRRAQDEWF